MEADRSLMTGTKLAPRNAYEMDYNTGATAGIAEMLLQSHRGYIHLLPALPSAWPSGQITGLCARGGFEIDLVWEVGRLTIAIVRSRLGGLCRVRAGVPLTVHHDGQRIETVQVAPGINEFETHIEAEYVLKESG